MTGRAYWITDLSSNVIGAFAYSCEATLTVRFHEGSWEAGAAGDRWDWNARGFPDADAAKSAAERYLAEREELRLLREENVALCPIGDRPVIESLRMQLLHAGEALAEVTRERDELREELAKLREPKEAGDG